MHNVTLVVANRADSAQVAGGGIYLNGEALASWQPNNSIATQAAVVATVPDGALVSSPSRRAAAAAAYPQAAARAAFPRRADGATASSVISTATFPCASTASAAFPMACQLIESLPLRISSFSGNVSCLLSGSIELDGGATAGAGAGAAWVLAAQDAIETFAGTPSPLPVRACALMRCEWEGAAAAGGDPRTTRVCKPVWPQPRQAEGGLLLQMTQREASVSYRVYPMASFANGSAIRPESIRHTAQPDVGVDTLELEEGAALNAFVLYGLGG